MLTDLANGKLVTTFRAPSEIFTLAVSPDGKWLATAEVDSVKVWDAETGRKALISRVVAIAPLPGFQPGQQIPGIELRLDAQSQDRGHRRSAFHPPGQSWRQRRRLLSPDGRRLLFCSGGVSVWDAVTGKRTAWLPAGSHHTLALSKDGKYLATCDRTGPSRSGMPPATPCCHPGGTHGRHLGAAFHPDGKRLASGGLDNTVKIWEVATGRQLLDLRRRRDSSAWPTVPTASNWRGRCSPASPGPGMQQQGLRTHVPRGHRPWWFGLQPGQQVAGDRRQGWDRQTVGHGLRQRKCARWA